jgi:glycosyltransferase involved in cell wall biosynthesis
VIPVLTVIIPAHDPDPERLRETLLGLRRQTMDANSWNTLLVDNASTQFPDSAWLKGNAPARCKVIREPELGLSAARRKGLSEATGEFAVLVDDDNVLEPDYLNQAVAIFGANPRIGVAGGRTSPRFDEEPREWTREFFPLLALRDLGDEDRMSEGLPQGIAARGHYPAFAPIGAGMALRRGAWDNWLAAPGAGLSDRRGSEFSSSGDNDIVLCAMRAGWEVGYFPKLKLSHLIPRGRLQPDYLAGLNRGIQKSWMQVLSRHDANPWPPLTASGAALRKAKAWFAYRAWSSPAARVRWSGACGHFDGRVPVQR